MRFSCRHETSFARYTSTSPSEHNAQSENPAEINSIFSILSRRNNASISKHCVARSLSPSSRFVIISIDCYTTINGKKRAGRKKIYRRKRAMIDKNDARYLFIARDTSHNVETSLRIFGRGSTDGEKRVRSAALFRSQRSVAYALSFHSSCIIWLSPRTAWIVRTAARWNASKSHWERSAVAEKRESLSAVTGNFRWRTRTADFAELLHNARACRHCGLR